jgi:hypothetical protein
MPHRKISGDGIYDNGMRILKEEKVTYFQVIISVIFQDIL